MGSHLQAIIARFEAIEQKFEYLEKRVSRLEGETDVIQERTCEHENRLEDLETWQEKVDDELEIY
jgi:predicted  nucleic acid-binding Zn-ribbon protein